MKKATTSTLLAGLKPISLKALDSVKLLNRVDRKYLIPVSALSSVVQLLCDNQYSILEIDGHRSFNYTTTYFDTNDYRFYKDHHNRLSSRIKVRTRSYKENNLHFFEIKIKTNIRTNKLRQRLEQETRHLSKEQNEKIHSLYPKTLESKLTPVLINSFKRMTLVNKDRTERCTIDIDIAFKDPTLSGSPIMMDKVAIIEVKQSKTSVLGGIIASLKKIRVHPMSITKYVLGLILTHPEIKSNSFKPLLHKIQKAGAQQLFIS